MSWFTEIRDEVVKKLNIDTPTGVIETGSKIVKDAKESLNKTNQPTPEVQPNPFSEAARAVTQSPLKFAGVSIPLLAAIGVVVYLIARKKVK